MGIRSTTASLDHRLWLRSFSLLEIELSQTFIATVLQPQRRLQYACLELLFSYLNLWDLFAFRGDAAYRPCLRELSNFCLCLAELFIISEVINSLCSSCVIGTKNGMECVFE